MSYLAAKDGQEKKIAERELESLNVIRELECQAK